MKKLITLAAIAMFSITSAFALNLRELQEKELNKKANAKITEYNDAVSFNVKYTGSSTQCVVNVGSGTFTTRLPGPGGTIDLNWDLAQAASNTMGELCDLINSEDDYSCSMIDSKRDDNSILTMNIAAVIASNAKAVGGYDVLIDSGCIELMSGNQFTLRLGITPSTDKSVVLKNCKTHFSAATTDDVMVWGKLAKYSGVSDGVTRNDTTVVYKQLFTESAERTIGNIYGGNFLEFAKNEHVVVGLFLTDITAQDTSDYIVCEWDEK